MSLELPSTLGAPPPSVYRRLASFLYEGVLLFGVVMIAGYFYSALTQQRHALQGQMGLQVFLFLVLGVYFVWFWSHGGQTVAMKTWRLQLVDAQGKAVTQARALVRYLASWLWFAPALLGSAALGLKSGGEITLALLVGVALYAALGALHPSRQFLHDRLCGTRVIDRQPKPQ